MDRDDLLGRGDSGQTDSREVSVAVAGCLLADASPLRKRLRKTHAQQSAGMDPTRLRKNREHRPRFQLAPDAHSDSRQLVSLLTALILASPAGLEPATSWFVAVNLFVDPAQLTALRAQKHPPLGPNRRPKTSQAAIEPRVGDVNRPVLRKGSAEAN